MIIQVKVITKASLNLVLGFENGVLKVKCTQTPEKGKANEKVIELLAEYFNVSKKNIEIIKGKTNSLKTVKINKNDHSY